MNSYEFFMAFYGLLLGLALAELMTNFGNLLREREQPRWGVLTPLAGAVIFIGIVTAFSDAWRNLRDVTISLRGLSVPILIAVSYYVAALMVAPRDAREWPDLDTYFLARRRFIFAPLLMTVLLTVFGIELPRNVMNWWSKTYVVVNALLLFTLAIPLVTARVRWIKMAMIAFLLVTIAIYFSGTSITAQVRWLLGG